MMTLDHQISYLSSVLEKYECILYISLFLKFTLQMLTSILIGALVDKKLLDYNEKISDIWPEFANNGKEEGTVADLLRHELGLPFLSEPLIASDCSVENIKANKIGSMIEKESYHFQPGEKRDYHLLSRGLIANEIVRRVDPKGRTMGELLRYHISEPLGAHVVMGMTEKGFKEKTYAQI